MNKKTMYTLILAAIAVIIVGAAVGILLTNNGNNGSQQQTGSGEYNGVYDTNSLQFNVDVVSNSGIVTYQFANKITDRQGGIILGEILRVDVQNGTEKHSYIYDTNTNEACTSVNGGAWTAIEGIFSETYMKEPASSYGSFQSAIANDWSGSGNCTYTDSWGNWEGASQEVTIYNIDLHANLPDSLFTTD